MAALMRQSPVEAAYVAHSSQWSRSVVAGVAALRFLAYWASASLHPPLAALGFALLSKRGLWGSCNQKAPF